MLAPYGDKARAHPSGLIDLSQGTPVDPTPDFIQDAFQKASNSPSYPVTAGTSQLREAITNWASKNLGATGEFDVLPLIGSKELVAWLPTIMESKHVLYPEIAYPTYLAGSMIAKIKASTVDFDATKWPAADLAWVNSPSNPTGRVNTDQELLSAIEWAQSGQRDRIVVADECYLEFGNEITPKSILSLTSGNNKNILAIHSLSKRSSMAGYRAAMMIGDKELIARILEVRKHAGMMVPLPVQQAMVAALGDNAHVAIARDCYNARKTKVRNAIKKHGFKVDYSEAGLYLWATRNERDWDSVAWFADLGILVTPGHFYGESGANHVRIAMTATDFQIDELVRRMG